MRHLLNTLFVLTEDAFLALDGENVAVKQANEVIGRYPLHILSGIVSFSYAGASPALMGACVKRDVALSFCTPRGKFLACACGESNGNVLLRRMQYRTADDPLQSCRIARSFIFGKVYNCRWVIQRTLRDHRLRVDEEKLQAASTQLKAQLPMIAAETSLDSLRGLEGASASIYFDVVNDLLLNNQAAFAFHGRSRRPPMDRINALLSFVYTLLAHDCASALEAVGLDSYVGFLHRDRPGRSSLALDMMEELRPCIGDRFVLTLINNRTVAPEDFEVRENGAVYLKDGARRTVLNQWQQRKQEQIIHPYLGEKLPWGLVPYLQALLLARYLRDDLDAYPPFLWK
ncbi:MAG: type I-C CRISPR-associated endonuclease Cas1c [Oscillospiraceae bacterium]|nr:type I-C CRISPR-associated endonuclease Cas1c [Oscillospiraceae bacterium]